MVALILAGAGFQLVKVAGGWRYQSHPDCAPWVERYVLDGQVKDALRKGAKLPNPANVRVTYGLIGYHTKQILGATTARKPGRKRPTKRPTRPKRSYSFLTNAIALSGRAG